LAVGMARRLRSWFHLCLSLKAQAKSLFLLLGMAGIKQGGAALGNAKTLGLLFPQGCNKLLMTASVGFGRPGKDAFHRVPLFVGEIGDAVERVLTSQNRELDAALLFPVMLRPHPLAESRSVKANQLW